MQYFRHIILFLFLSYFLVSCAGPNMYYKRLDDLVINGQYKEASVLANTSRQKEYGEKNALLYYFDYGMLLHLSGNYSESNIAFEKAKSIAEEYFTKSITTEASTFLVNDTMRPYYGEDFERALIHIFSALNYVLLGQDQEALVEARQVDHFLNTLQTNYGYKNVYKEDAFARYLMGMLYENMGEINDAYISYQQALEAYGAYFKSYAVVPPPKLISDIIRTGRKLGFNDEVAQIEKKWTVPKDNLTTNPSEGELVILHYNGLSPVKAEDFFEISFGKGWLYVGNVTPQGEDAKQVEQAGAIARSILATDMIRIAFPKYVPVDYKIKNSKIRIVDLNKDFEAGELVQDVGKIAEANLNDRITRIRTKAIARAAVRYALSKKVVQAISSNQRKEDRELVGFLANAALNTLSTAIEHADTRSWRSLPDKIFLQRIVLPEGNHSIQMLCYNQFGSVISTKNVENIKIKAGKKTFIVVRTAQ